MMFRFLILIFYIITNTQSFHGKNGNKNIQIFSYISKQTDCGLIEIDEFTPSNEAIFNNFNEDSNIDEADQTDSFNKPIANLSSCLNNENIKYSSFSTYLSSNVAQTIFNEYFHMDKKQGTLFLTKPIDREKICLQSEALERIKRSLLYSNHFSDAINCDCKSEVCELRFKFVAFLKKKPNRSSRNKGPGFLKYQYHHQRNKKNQHKTMMITFVVKDLNDNSPEFEKNYHFLNFSEQIGVAPSKNNHKASNISPLCPLSSEITDFEQFQKALIPLERAIDLDSGKNSEISYTLVLFEDQNFKFVEEIKLEKDTSKRENLIKSALTDQIENCNDKFELIQTKPTDGKFTFDSKNKIYDFDISSQNNHIHKPLLFLKVNAFFDREQRDVYNFIIFANDKKKQNKILELNQAKKDFNHLIKGNNYMLIRLAITDLNDNSPVFSQVKYNFELNEIVSYNLEGETYDYFDQLNSTCSALKNSLKVKATDKDSDQNGLIKYKLIQQVHRKNSNFKRNRKEILKSMHGLELDSNSFFSIDQSDGSVSLKVCKEINSRFKLTKKKFIELTSLLDYELYTKHILVVEAIDTSIYNPLQTFVTLELKLNDLNDNSPYLVNFFTKSCSSKIDNLVGETPNKSLYFKKKEANITIDYFEPQPNIIKGALTANGKQRFISSRIIISNLSESSNIGTCIGQFFIKDLDTLERNKKIEAILFEDKEKLLFKSTLQINPAAKLSKTSKILFKSLQNNERKLRHLNETILNEDHKKENIATQEAFEMFLNYQFDAEKSQKHEFLILLKDSGEDVSFESYTHLIINLKDENDKIPQFHKSYFQFSMFEWFGRKDGLIGKNQPADMSKFCLEKITVTDEDVTKENSEIYYELNEINDDKYSRTHRSRNTRFKYNAMDLFTVDHITGIICVKNDSLDRLDREIKTSYKFYLTAVNIRSEIPLKSSILIEIILKDLNDNQPEFSLNRYNFFIPEKDSNLVNSLVLRSESQKGRRKILYSVGKVKALDKDIGFNSQLKYFLKPKSMNPTYKSYYELNTNNKKNPFMGLNKIPLSKVNIELRSSITSKTPRFFKSIHNLNNVIHINETNGEIFLLQQFDRELITHIYFTVFVIDRLGNDKLGGEPALSNSVPVVIEFIDINDSKPKCNNVELKYDHDNSYRREKPFVFSVYMDLSLLTLNTLVSSYPIYKLDCQDLDLGKNAELNYEIEKIYLKRIDDNKFENTKIIFSLNDFIDSLSLNQKRILGEFDQTNDHDSSKKTNYIKNSQLFSIDRKTGLVYFNYIQELWQSSSFYSTLFFQNYFLVLRIKVSDKGMITSQNSFMLKLRFCFKNSLHGSTAVESKYCDFNYYGAEINKTNDSHNKFIIQRIENLEEELKVYDYPMDGLSQHYEINHYDDSLDYIPDSNEFDEYDIKMDQHFFDNNFKIIKSDQLNKTSEKFSTLYGAENAGYSKNNLDLKIVFMHFLTSYLCTFLIF